MLFKFRFLYLLLFLLLLLLIYPYVSNISFPIVEFLLSAILLSAIFGLNQEKKLFRIGLLIGIPAILTNIIGQFWDNDTLFVINTFIWLCFYFFIIIVLFRHVLTTNTITADLIFASANIYLMAGIAWWTIYSLLVEFQPHAFSSNKGDDLIYFSFVTLTTLGFGEITPVTQHARSLVILEAIFGTLYPAILISRLVGIHASQPISNEHN